MTRRFGTLERFLVVMAIAILVGLIARAAGGYLGIGTAAGASREK